MTVSLTIKGVPQEVNLALDQAAVNARRSKNAQAIVWLEERARQEPTRLPPEELRRRIRALDQKWRTTISAEEHRRWVRKGRA